MPTWRQKEPIPTLSKWISIGTSGLCPSRWPHDFSLVHLGKYLPSWPSLQHWFTTLAFINVLTPLKQNYFLTFPTNSHSWASFFSLDLLSFCEMKIPALGKTEGRKGNRRFSPCLVEQSTWGYIANAEFIWKWGPNYLLMLNAYKSRE